MNQLDEYCKSHDIFYDKYKSVKERHIADKLLSRQAAQLAKQKGLDFKVRLAAYLISKVMAGKVMMGLGLSGRKKKPCKSKRKTPKKQKGSGIKRNVHKKGRKKRVKKIRKGGKLEISSKALQKIVKKTRDVLKRKNPDSEVRAVKIGLDIAKKALKGKKKLQLGASRIIKIPQSGGFLGLVPLLTAISTISGAFGSITGIIENIGKIRDLWKKYKSSKEEIAPVQVGKGLQIRKHKKGLAFFS